MYDYNRFSGIQDKIRQSNLDQELKDILDDILYEIDSARYSAEQAYNVAQGIEEWS